MNNETERPIDTNDLPQKVFKEKLPDQFPQTADTGNPLKRGEPKDHEGLVGREAEKTSKEDGLNQAGSGGTAGAFEGFEDQQTDE